MNFAVKYRPNTFDEVVGQKVVVKVLKKQLETNTHKNAYLFSGFSGCGKTSVARIFANELNKHQGEPIEIDAASNNGVDNVRKITEQANMRSLTSEYKFFIIDECHALTTQAWQAFLKTIEESPKHTIFVFCTTEINKVPKMIVNRCQTFHFGKISKKDLMENLYRVCRLENIDVEDGTLELIVKHANGSVRQSLTDLEKCYDFKTQDRLTVEDVSVALGEYNYDVFFDLLVAIINKDLELIYTTLETVFKYQSEPDKFLEEFIKFVLEISKYTIFKSYDIIDVPDIYPEQMKFFLNKPSKYYVDLFLKLIEKKQLLKGAVNKQMMLEALLGGLINE